MEHVAIVAQPEAILLVQQRPERPHEDIEILPIEHCDREEGLAAGLLFFLEDCAGNAMPVVVATQDDIAGAVAIYQVVPGAPDLREVNVKMALKIADDPTLAILVELHRKPV